MNTLLLIFLAPFLTSTAVGQVQDVQQDSFFDTAALKVYCRLGFTFNQDTTHCSPTIEEQPQTVQEKVVEVVRNVFVPVASAQEPSDSYLEAMIRRIVLELLPQPQLVQGPKGDKGDKGDPGTQTFGSDLLNTPVTFWTGGGGSSSSGGTTVVNNYYTASSGTSTVSSNTLTFSTTTGILTSDVGGVVATTTIGVASTTTITADNGLTINPANNVQLGGILTQDTSIDLDTRVLDFDQTSTSSRFRIRGASGYAAGFSTQDIFQLEHYVGEGFAISSYEQGPLVTDPHGTFLNFTDNLASPVMSPNGAYLYSDQTSGEIGMGRWAGGQISITPTSVTTLSPGSITVSAQGNIVTTSDNEQSFLANNANALGPVSSGFNFNVFNGTGNDIAIANFNGGAGQGVDMFVGQFDPNGQYTADPGSFYYNMSPANDDEILWLKGTGGGGAGTNTGWVPVLTGTSTGSAWLLAGNSGTNSANDFVGTTDAQDLVFRTNNAEVVRFTQTGRFDFTNPLANVLLDGGNETMTGAFNIAIGESALSQNNTGSGNVVMGNNAALLNTTGSSNVAIGQAALLLNNGDTNTAVGQGAGIVSNGTSNTFIGYGAGNAQTAGDNNILIGQLANVANTTGSNQLSIGNWIYGDNGSIGVGTPTPDDDFEVVNAAGAGVSVDTESGSGAEARLTVQTGDGSGTWGESVLYLNTGGDSLGQQWWMFMDDSTLNELGDANRLGFYDGTDIVMSLDGDSNRLGIGTTTPATALHVEHSLNSAGGIRVSNYSTGTAAISQLLFQNASSTGGIGLLGPNFALPNLANRLGVVADPGLSGLYLGTHATGQDIVFNTGGFVSANERMRISATGEIGIGTPTPTERLDVSGNVRFSGALMPNNLAGATGTILLSQGSGLAPVWIATSSLGISASISSSTIASNFGFIQNGNSFGTTGVLGTNDAFGLTFETVNTPRVTIGTTGAIVVAGETLGGGTYTMNVGASAGSHALRVTGVSDTIYAQQGGGSDVFTIRTAGTNTFLNATAGNTLALGVGGTTDNSMSIASNGDTTVRHRFFVSDAFTGSGVARVGQTIQSATNSGNQTGNTTQLLIQPDDGGVNSTATNIGLSVNMGSLSGGTNYAAVFQNGNVGIGTTSPGSLLSVAGDILSNHVVPNGPYGSNVSNYDLGATSARWREVWGNVINVGGASTWSLVNNATRLDFSAGASGSGPERVTFLTGGEVGIGNTAPTDRLHIGNATGPSVRIGVDSATQSGIVFREGGVARWSFINGDLGSGVFGLINHSSGSYALTIATSSYVGLSNNSPLFLLHTGSSSITSGTTVARFENAGGTCDVTPNVAGGITCTSDQNLKKDIESIDPIDILTRLLTVEVKSYRMNADTSTSTKQTGFLAQQLETQFPGLVLTSIEGTKSVSYAGMTPILTQAIQTLYKFMTDIGVTIEGGVAKIGNFFAKKVTTEELCVGNVCVTESQFLQMVQSTQAASNVVNTELSGENSSDNETINNTPEVSDSNLSEDQINEEGTNQLSGTPLNVETNLSNIEPVVETMSDAVVSTDSIE